MVPKLPDDGDHALLLRGEGSTAATNSLLIQVPSFYCALLESINQTQQAASRLEARGDEGAGEVVRAVAELLHLAGGHLVGRPRSIESHIWIYFPVSGLCLDGGSR